MHVKAIIKKGKKDIKSDGKTTIYLALRHQRRESLVATEKRIAPDQWDDDAGMPNKKASNATLLKKWLIQETEKIEAIILDLETSSDRTLTFEQVKAKYLTGDQVPVVSFCRTELDKEAPRIAHKTYKDYERCIKNLEEYRPHLTFDQMDEQFLQDYDYYLETVKGHELNGRAHDFRMLRKYTNVAIKKGLTKTYAFKDYKIRTQETEKEYNTPEEIDRLETLFHQFSLPLSLQKTLGFYLFSCFTGIPGDDLRHKEERLKFNENTVIYIRGKTKRKGKLLVVPIISRGKKLLPFLQEHKMKLHADRVNKDLSKIMSLLNIKKHITFHCARNTFYVLARRSGVSEGAIQDILGHSLPSTTNIYKKIDGEFIRNEINKMD